MLKNEFLELTGLKEIDDELFKLLLGTYDELSIYASFYGERAISKEEFCRYWVNHKDYLIVTLTGTLMGMRERYCKLASACIEGDFDMVKSLINKDIDIVTLIKLKVACGARLSTEEVKYVKQYLE